MVAAAWPPGHAVIEIVHADHRKVHVAPCRVDEVIAADCKQVPVAAENDHRKLGVGELHAGGKRNRPAVRGVVGIEIDIARAPSRTSYPRDYRGLCRVVSR